MRRPILLLALGLAGCEASAPPGYTVIEGFVAAAQRSLCRPVELGMDAAPAELRLASDSTWTVLDGSRPAVLEFDDAFRLLHRTGIPAAGPGAAKEPVSVAALGDSAWGVVARGNLRLVVLARDGRELGASALDFIPHSVAATPSGDLLLTAMPFGDRPPTLLVRYDGIRLTPLPVPRRSYPDMMVNALGNTALVETLPDGSALLVHQFLAPRAFRVGADGSVEALEAPTPDGTRERIDFVPTPPITEEQLPRTLLPAMAMSVDPVAAEVYLMTRSGRDREGRPERAILRLTDRLRFIEGFTLDVAAVGLVYLPRRELAVVVDDQDRFFVCPVPHTRSRHARAD